jgi:creatinine amidohydrolase
MTDRHPYHVKTLLPHEVRDHLARDSKLIVPVGTCEPHGKHLPLGCDTIIVEQLADDLSRDFAVLRAPTVEYGVNSLMPRPAPGNATVRRKTLHRLMNDLVGSWEQSGVTEFIILTAHGHDPHQEALSTVRADRARVQVVDVFAMEFPDLLPTPLGPIHGGEVDTSLLLHLAPELVQIERAEDFIISDRSRLKHRRGATVKLPRRSSGSLGRPTSASATLGERVYQRIYDRIAERIFKVS